MSEVDFMRPLNSKSDSESLLSPSSSFMNIKSNEEFASSETGENEKGYKSQNRDCVKSEYVICSVCPSHSLGSPTHILSLFGFASFIYYRHFQPF